MVGGDHHRTDRISSMTTLVLDLGDRAVELLHLGRGHTDNDLLLHIADADAWLVGDLVEQSGPPMYGSGCFPLDWGPTVTRLAGRLEASTMVVPGHGEAVDAAFVRRQAAELAAVGALVRELHAAGVPQHKAVAAGSGRWPFPDAGLQPAVDAAYGQLAAGPGPD